VVPCSKSWPAVFSESNRRFLAFMRMGIKTMVITACAKCEGHTFERGLVTPLGEQGAVSLLRCAGCGTAIGTLDGQLVLERLQTQVAEINAGLVRIANALS
jgi:hypothetical protein